MLYKLKLHEVYVDKKINATITRVPGGWIYYWTNREGSIFVPYSNEYS